MDVGNFSMKSYVVDINKIRLVEIIQKDIESIIFGELMEVKARVIHFPVYCTKWVRRCSRYAHQQTCLCNILQYFTFVKTLIFR